MAEEKISIVDRIAQYCLEHIHSGEWKPGEKIPSEAELNAVFKVSKVSIRSALQLLRAKGYIVTYHGRGSFVSEHLPTVDNRDVILNLSRQDLRDITEFRQAVEIMAIRLAIERGTPADLEQIRLALEQMRRAKDDYSQYTRADADFHMGIIRASHNSILLEAVMAIQNRYLHYLDEMNRYFVNKLDASVQNHQQLFDAISLGDTDLAVSIAMIDLRRNIHRIDKQLAGEDAEI
ncbi:FadR family transcriptional regulator [Ruminococcaceae bacterium OttesenSCG-928-L11]|nr:FadR family transcriptional regulator [Ruminococcaceae bacterium OttesenSCG-928-L11]